MSATLSDVAKRAGVSMKTVSRVINQEDRVAETTRQKVLAAIEELGYFPNVWAQRLARGYSGLIGLFMHDATAAYITAVMNGIMDIGDTTGYRLSLYRLDVRGTPGRSPRRLEWPRSAAWRGLSSPRRATTRPNSPARFRK
jgi:LacI family transcriptional regulator